MDSRDYEVPLSATQMAPKAVPSTGIKAPLTVDDSDSEYSVSSKSYNNSPTSSYYRGSESQGFESGEDELETAAERPLSDGDNNSVEETHFAKEYAFSGPSVESKEIVQESASVSSTDRRGFLRPSARNSGIAFVQESGSGSFSELANVLRPYVRIPVERSYERAVSIRDSGSSQPYLSESDETTKDDGIVLSNIISPPAVASIDEEVLINEVTPIVDANISVVKKLHVPIALISEDSDNDSQGSEVLEDDDFSGIVRVPSIEILQRVDSAPKATISELYEEDDNEYQTENKVEMEFVENLRIGNGFMNFMNDVNKVQIGAEDSIPHSLSTNTNQDEVPDDGAEARVDSLYASDKQRTISEPEKKVYSLDLDDEIQEFNEVDDQRKSVDSFNQRGSMDLFKCSCDFGEESSREKETKASNNYIDSLFSSEDIDNKNMEYESAPYQELDLFSSTDVNRCEFASNGFEGEDLVHETEEARHIEQFPEVLKDSTLQADIKIMVDQMERDQKLTSISSGVTWQAQSLEINRLTISDLDKKVDSDDSMSNYKQVMHSAATGESELASSEEELKKIRQSIVKYVRLFHTYSPEKSISALVLHRLTVAESSFASDVFHLDSTEKAAMDINSQSKGDLDISLTLLVIGKTGVGKSATINSIFRERKTSVDAFHPTMADVKEITGTVCGGVKIRAFDTPGLRTSMIDQSINKKILSTIKKSIKKYPPDVVLYVDRLDTHTSYDDDLPLLKYVTSYLGSSIWAKSVIVLTHSSSIPPDGSDGNPLSPKSFVSLRSGVIQQLINHSSMNPSSMAPVNLIENKPFTEKNEIGKALPSNLILLCYSMKTLFESGIYIAFHPEIENYNAFEEQLTLVGKAGFVLRSQEDKAYGANLLVYKRRDGYHITRDQNLESQISVTKSLKVSRAGLARGKSDQIRINTVCSHPLQVAAIALVTAALAIFKKIPAQSR